LSTIVPHGIGILLRGLAIATFGSALLQDFVTSRMIFNLLLIVSEQQQQQQPQGYNRYNRLTKNMHVITGATDTAAARSNHEYIGQQIYRSADPIMLQQGSHRTQRQTKANEGEQSEV
jgi:hypothetical protein